MKVYPVDKYSYKVTDRKITASSTYAGVTVSGCARCHPGDNFDEAVGKELAAARCGLKIAHKRHVQAKKAWAKAQDDFEQAIYKLRKARDYRDDAEKAVVMAQAKVNHLEDTM